MRGSGAPTHTPSPTVPRPTPASAGGTRSPRPELVPSPVPWPPPSPIRCLGPWVSGPLLLNSDPTSPPYPPAPGASTTLHVFDSPRLGWVHLPGTRPSSNPPSPTHLCSPPSYFSTTPVEEKRRTSTNRPAPMGSLPTDINILFLRIKITSKIISK